MRNTEHNTAAIKLAFDYYDAILKAGDKYGDMVTLSQVYEFIGGGSRLGIAANRHKSLDILASIDRVDYFEDGRTTHIIIRLPLRKYVFAEMPHVIDDDNMPPVRTIEQPVRKSVTPYFDFIKNWLWLIPPYRKIRLTAYPESTIDTQGIHEYR